MANFPATDANDTFAGTWNADRFVGGKGDDVAYGWDGADTFFGGADNDTFFGQAGSDIGYGGTGDDKLQGGGDVDTLYGGAGNDSLMLGTFSGSAGEAYGGTGNDMIQVLSGGLGLVIDGGAGIDTAAFFMSPQSPTGDIEIDFSGTPRASSVNGGAFTLVSVEKLYAYIASEGHHRIIGSALADSVWLVDHVDASVVDLGAGDDFAHVDIGRGHRVQGGTGTDTLRINSTGPVTLVVDDATQTISGTGDTLQGFENYETVVVGAAYVLFGAGNDALYGGYYDDIGHGGGGRDLLRGSRGADILYGDEDRDTVSGGTGNDQLFGGEGSDVLNGGPGEDTVHGGAGDDVIRGGKAGAGVLWGDEGADRFVFGLDAVSPHLIMDFTSGSDSLRFARSLLQFGPSDPGPLPDDLLSFGTAQGEAAQFVLRERADLGELWLEWDPNGDDPAGGTYLMLRLTAGTTLAASDIFLI
ncbi:calcium-binding protein [Stagnihabitans tardus]|uniref:Calcium-binding protein n=1 Tax=Stagnihabitans tardus TaxID=2699202 RepID=A0AAE4Y778_9RHOB|nr:calcium-binding protein [Stagnihabitans tardus]NBZ86051.1 hypothetical protein [Stagnihabitans tardus]